MAELKARRSHPRVRDVAIGIYTELHRLLHYYVLALAEGWDGNLTCIVANQKHRKAHPCKGVGLV